MPFIMRLLHKESTNLQVQKTFEKGKEYSPVIVSDDYRGIFLF
jgi:hypothetical protein